MILFCRRDKNVLTEWITRSCEGLEYGLSRRIFYMQAVNCPHLLVSPTMKAKTTVA